MDFNTRPSYQQMQTARPAASQPDMPRGTEPHVNPNDRRNRNAADLFAKCSHVGSAALLVILAFLVAALVWLIYTSSPTPESKYVSTQKLQAVFLNTGQVYFGDISSLNKDYLVLTNVYYLQSNNSGSQPSTSTTNQNVSLVKLGCELHKPYDAMIISTAQVTFWENLQSDGQVAKAVAQFVQQNPNGQKCSDQPATSPNLQNQGTSNSSTATKP